ncbi:MAG: nuclear transport factor 2 family protein [Ginsengibacter sp.]
MKKFVYLFLFFFAFVTLAVAQSYEESKVAAASAALIKAMIDADKIVLESLTAEELSYGHSTGKIENKTEFVTPMINGVLDFLSIDITDQTIKVAGKNAIVRNTFTAKLTNSGKALEIKIGVLMVWKKVKGKWKLLARQGYKIT